MKTTENELYFTMKSHLDRTSHKHFRHMILLTVFPVQPLPDLLPFPHDQLKLWPIFPQENFNSSHQQNVIKISFPTTL